MERYLEWWIWLRYVVPILAIAACVITVLLVIQIAAAKDSLRKRRRR
jgi:hypothetical protein